MTSISAEMSALATVTMVDVYRRYVRPTASDGHYLLASRLGTVFWGIYAIVCAQFIKGMGSLIEVVNILGSLFYGGMLGVFVLAFVFKNVTARGAFYGVLVGEAVIFACWKFTSIAFLWFNVVGCLTVVVTAVIISALSPERAAAVPASSGANPAP
jgi:Na+/proline symporter